jgi:hypothetical protein
MGADQGRLHFGAILLVFTLLIGLPTAEAVKPYTRVVNNTIVWNMANYAILSTSSIVGDRFPYAGLRYLANNKIFDDVNPSGGKYIYSGKQT